MDGCSSGGNPLSRAHNLLFGSPLDVPRTKAKAPGLAESFRTAHSDIKAPEGLNGVTAGTPSPGRTDRSPQRRQDWEAAWNAAVVPTAGQKPASSGLNDLTGSNLSSMAGTDNDHGVANHHNASAEEPQCSIPDTLPPGNPCDAGSKNGSGISDETSYEKHQNLMLQTVRNIIDMQKTQSFRNPLSSMTHCDATKHLGRQKFILTNPVVKSRL